MQVHRADSRVKGEPSLPKANKKVKAFLKKVKGMSPLSIRKKIMHELLEGQLELKEGTYIFSGLRESQLAVKEPMRRALLGKKLCEKLKSSNTEYRNPCVSTSYLPGTPIPGCRNFLKANGESDIKHHVPHSCYRFETCSLEDYSSSYFLPNPKSKDKTDFMTLWNQTEWQVQIACKKRKTLPVHRVEPNSFVTLQANGQKHAPKWELAHKATLESYGKSDIAFNPQLKELGPITLDNISDPLIQYTGELHLNRKVMCELFKHDTKQELKFAESEAELSTNLKKAEKTSAKTNSDSTDIILVENSFCHTSGLVLRLTQTPSKRCEVFILESLSPRSSVAISMRELICPRLREVFSDYDLRILIPKFGNQYDFTSCGVITLDWATRIQNDKDSVLTNKIFQMEATRFEGADDIYTVAKLPAEMMEFYQGKMEYFEQYLLESDQAEALKEKISDQTFETSEGDKRIRLNAAALLERYRQILTLRSIKEEKKASAREGHEHQSTIDSDDDSISLPH